MFFSDIFLKDQVNSDTSRKLFKTSDQHHTSFKKPTLHIFRLGRRSDSNFLWFANPFNLHKNGIVECCASCRECPNTEREVTAEGQKNPDNSPLWSDDVHHSRNLDKRWGGNRYVSSGDLWIFSAETSKSFMKNQCQDINREGKLTGKILNNKPKASGLTCQRSTNWAI